MQLHRRLMASSAAMLLAATLAHAASAQTATLQDGTVLTRNNPLVPFATEGPMWDMNVAGRTLDVVGKRITIPTTINGVEFLISGSSVLGNDGEAATGIGGTNFERVSDTHATTTGTILTPVGAGLGSERLGPTRSIFSTSEARDMTSALLPVTRDAGAQALVESNYFDMLQSTYALHAAVLPADFLARSGIRGPDVSTWEYPTTAAGTFKSAGHSYSDAAGNQYLIPDIEAVIELSENVSQGIVTSVARGSVGVPDSFVIGELLVIFKQDPRFGADVLGVGGTPLPRELFFDLIVVGETLVDTIGYIVGEHVLFVQKLGTDLIDNTAGPTIGVDRVRFRDDKDELRLRGTVIQADGLDLFALLGARVFQIGLALDPLTGLLSFDARFEVQDLAAVNEFTLELRDGTGAVVGSETVAR